MNTLKGRVHSIQSLGTVDGPGIRFVVFMQGCNLRCSCCHNPDTWSADGGELYSPEDIVSKVKRYKEYFGHLGGITVSGGEPLLQAEFVLEVFKLCHQEGINTCLDTSGSIYNAVIEELIHNTDRILLDIKYINADLYKQYVGCDIEKVLFFLNKLDEFNKRVTIRQVIIPNVNDKEDDVLELKRLCSGYSCIDNIELLPFRKICLVKYDNLGIEFPFGCYDEPTEELMSHLNEIIK